MTSKRFKGRHNSSHDYTMNLYASFSVIYFVITRHSHSLAKQTRQGSWVFNGDTEC